MKEKGRAVCVAGIALCGLIGGASATMAQNKLCVSDINMTLSKTPMNAKYNSSRSKEGYFDGKPLGIPIADSWTHGGCDTQGHCQDNSIMNISVKKRVFGIENNSGESGCLDAVALITSDQRQTAGVPPPEKNGQAWKRIGMIEGQTTRALRVDFSKPMVTGNPFTTKEDPYTLCGNSKRDGHWLCTNTLYKKEAKHGSDHSTWIVTDVFTEIDKEYNNHVDWDSNTYCAGTWTVKDGHNIRLMVKVEPYDNFVPQPKAAEPLRLDYGWKPIGRTTGGKHTISYNTGVVEGEGFMTGKEITKEVERAISIEVGAEFGSDAIGYKGHVNITGSYGWKDAETTKREITKNFELQKSQTQTTECESGALWLWAYTLTYEKGGATAAVTIPSSPMFACTTPDDYPSDKQLHDPLWKGCEREEDPKRKGTWQCRSDETIKNSSGKYLDVDGPCGGTNGCKVQIWEGNDRPNQQWTPKDGQLVSGVGGLCLDVDGTCGGKNGCKVQVWQCNGSPNQQWTFKDGQIVNGVGGLCLDVDGPCYGKNGCKVQVWECNGSPNQEWSSSLATDQPTLKKDGNNGTVKKGGNNGTVSCNTYCGAAKADGKPVWGEKIGYCVEAKYRVSGQTVSCDTAPGLKEGDQLECLCAPDVKVKHGDNGDASCKTYCAQSECVSAWNNLTGWFATCDDRPTSGVLKGAELTCTCR